MKRPHCLYAAMLLSLILGIHEGNVALWKEEGQPPLKVFPCRAAMLPADARAALEEGVRIDSIEQLEALAENYLS